jgi:hypothetical protein
MDSRPNVTDDVPSVMISGFTRKIPTPIPLARPIPRPTARPATMPETVPLFPCHEVAKAAAVAVNATERSTPPVSITRVWPAAIIPSGAATRNVVESWFHVMNGSPASWRLTMSVSTNSRTSTPTRTTTGLSTRNRLAAVSRLSRSNVSGATVTSASSS